jgi:hypothetical protein
MVAHAYEGKGDFDRNDFGDIRCLRIFRKAGKATARFLRRMRYGTAGHELEAIRQMETVPDNRHQLHPR